MSGMERNPRTAALDVVCEEWTSRLAAVRVGPLHRDTMIGDSKKGCLPCRLIDAPRAILKQGAGDAGLAVSALRITQRVVNLDDEATNERITEQDTRGPAIVTWRCCVDQAE